MSGWALLVRRGERCRPLAVRSGDVLGVDGHVKLRGPGVRARHARFTLRRGGPCLEAIDDAPLRMGGQVSGAVTASEGDVVWLGGQAALVVRAERHGRRWWLDVGGLQSGSERAWRAWHELAIAAASPWPMLLLGESGTGKEVAARLCHARSQRGGSPFVAVNCAALPAALIEAELFGATKGAYTGAVGNREGAFSRADGGTLLLDEVGELPLPVQAALLRALESGEVQVVGGPTRQVDVRVIAATNVDLRVAVRRGTFRLDLLHRLDVLQVTLPPVRERDGDAGRLLQQLLQRPLPASVTAWADRCAWPGNVRQLRNLARRLDVLQPHGPLRLSTVRRIAGEASVSRARRPQPPVSRLATVKAALAGADTVAAAQRASGLPRSTFYRYLARARCGGEQQTRPVFDAPRRAASVLTGPALAAASAVVAG